MLFSSPCYNGLSSKVTNVRKYRNQTLDSGCILPESMPCWGRPGPHRYDAALNDLGSRSEEEALLAENIRRDDRLSDERAAVFDNMVPALHSSINEPSADELLEAFRNYHETRVRTGAPDYLNDALNFRNRRKFRNLDIELLHVLDVTGLDFAFEWARKERRYPEFSTYPSDSVKAFRWLKDRLDSPMRTEFLEAVLDVLDAFGQKNRPYGPVWFTTRTAFGGTIDEDCSHWLAILGMEKKRLKLCLVVLTYRARDAGTVYRPTQLDAGPNCDHFPSPNRFNAWSGHPVDFDATPTDRVLRVELIHGPIRQDRQNWARFQESFQTLERTSVPVLNRAMARNVHTSLLHQKYGPEIQAWLNVKT
jgi:hypothetical protein